MSGSEIKDYLAKAGIRRVGELDTALVEAFGQEEGERHIERLTELFDISERRLVYGEKDTPYPRRQEEMVDYLNQSLPMSLLASSFYDRVFFKKAMDYLVSHDFFGAGEIFDIGCGNGVLTCFVALRHPVAVVTGFDLSQNAIAVARELAERLGVKNICFDNLEVPRRRQCDTLFSCRTVQENVAWRPLCEADALTVDGYVKLHEAYARRLSSLVKVGGHLVSVERYEDDDAYAGLCRALESAGFCRIRGTHVQFSCKNGDGTATFQAIVFEKT